MKKRIISGIVMSIIFTISFLLGPIAFKILIGAVALFAFKEIITLPNIKDHLNIPIIILGLISLMSLIYIVNDNYALYVGFSYQSLIFMLFTLIIPILFIKKYDTETALYYMVLLLILGLSSNSAIMLYTSNKWLLLYIILVICVTDIGAYFIGSYVGTHKLSKISPNKTVEGSIGGIICSSIIGAFYYMAVINKASVLRIIFISILISIFGQIGDLFFSKIKRENNIKDFSNLIPGHGGMLDRIDSLIFGILLYTLICTII